jgi:hypothetical protein
MRQLFSKAELRDLSLVLAVVMLLASVPANSGVVLFAGPSRPELTINICQPIQTFAQMSNVLVARPATVLPEIVLRDSGLAAPKETVRLVELKIAPDTPPPKLPV